MTASPLPRLHTHSEGSADTHGLTASIGSSHILDPLTGGTDVRRQTDIFTHVVVPDSHSKHREAHTGHSDTHKPIDTGTPDRTCWLACTHTPQPQSSHRHTHTHTHQTQTGHIRHSQTHWHRDTLTHTARAHVDTCTHQPQTSHTHTDLTQASHGPHTHKHTHQTDIG